MSDFPLNIISFDFSDLITGFLDLKKFFRLFRLFSPKNLIKRLKTLKKTPF